MYNNGPNGAHWRALVRDSQEFYIKIDHCVHRYNWVRQYWRVTNREEAKNQNKELKMICNEIDEHISFLRDLNEEIELLEHEEWMLEDLADQRLRATPEPLA